MESSKKKKYLLFNKSDGRPDKEKPCAFFNSPAGCRNGVNCIFLHAPSDSIPTSSSFAQPSFAQPPQPIVQPPQPIAYQPQSVFQPSQPIQAPATATKPNKDKKQPAPKIQQTPSSLSHPVVSTPSMMISATKAVDSSGKKRNRKPTNDDDEDLDDTNFLFSAVNSVIEGQAMMMSPQTPVKKEPTPKKNQKLPQQQPSTLLSQFSASKPSSASLVPALSSIIAPPPPTQAFKPSFQASFDSSPFSQPSQSPPPTFSHQTAPLSLPTQSPPTQGQGPVRNNSGKSAKFAPTLPPPPPVTTTTPAPTPSIPSASSSPKQRQQQQKQNKPKSPFGASGTPTSAPSLPPGLSALIQSSLPQPTPQPQTQPQLQTQTQPAQPKPSIFPISLPPGQSSDLSSWHRLVQVTRSHPRYAKDYSFETDPMWVQPREHSDWARATNVPAVVALDCEMCECTDPVTGDKDGSALIRFSAVDVMRNNAVLCDMLVLPALSISDCRTRIHGITEQMLHDAAQKGPCTLRHAQAALMKFCSSQTILVGHSLLNDLKALKFNHNLVVDTAYLFPVATPAGEISSSSPSLRELADQILKARMENEIHDSVQDATASANAAAYLIINGSSPAIVRQVTEKIPKGQSLLLHRIPEGCTEEHVYEMLTKQTSIIPAEIQVLNPPSSAGNGKMLVTFSSPQHAELAFETFTGGLYFDKQNRAQKRIHLKVGGYVCIRRNYSDPQSEPSENKE